MFGLEGHGVVPCKLYEEAHWCTRILLTDDICSRYSRWADSAPSASNFTLARASYAAPLPLHRFSERSENPPQSPPGRLWTESFPTPMDFLNFSGLRGFVGAFRADAAPLSSSPAPTAPECPAEKHSNALERMERRGWRTRLSSTGQRTGGLLWRLERGIGRFAHTDHEPVHEPGSSISDEATTDRQGGHRTSLLTTAIPVHCVDLQNEHATCNARQINENELGTQSLSTPLALSFLPPLANTGRIQPPTQRGLQCRAPVGGLLWTSAVGSEGYKGWRDLQRIFRAAEDSAGCRELLRAAGAAASHHNRQSC